MEVLRKNILFKNRASRERDVDQIQFRGLDFLIHKMTLYGLSDLSFPLQKYSLEWTVVVMCVWMVESVEKGHIICPTHGGAPFSHWGSHTDDHTLLLWCVCRRAQRLICAMRATMWRTCSPPWPSLRRTERGTAPNAGPCCPGLAGSRPSSGETVSPEHWYTDVMESRNELLKWNTNTKELYWHHYTKNILPKHAAQGVTTKQKKN